MQLSKFATPLAVVGIVATIYYSEHVIVPPQKDNKVHITYWEKWTGFEGDAMKATVEEFNRTQNRIHVDLLTVSGIENKTLLAVAGGDPPDVAGLYGPNVPQYADDNAVMVLDDYCARNGIRRANYIPVYFDIGVYHGHIYSLPTTPASTALHYDKKMFREAGLDPEKPPQTIEEMDADAAKLTTYTPDHKIDKAGFMPAEPGWWNWSWGYLFGGKLWDGKTKITANSPENVRAFEWIQSYSKQFGATNLQTFRSGLGNFSSPQNGFLDGKVAMELQGVWMYNFIDKYAPQLEKPKLEWAAVPFPHPANRPDLANATHIDEDVLVIPRGARHPDEAFEFLKFIESQQGMEMLCLGQRKHSPLAQVSADFYRHHPNPFIKLFYSLASTPNPIVPPKFGIWPEYSNELTNAFDEITLQKKTPKEALDYVQARMQPKLDEYLERQRLRGVTQ
jgi:ABC-type glycerol-3-phosphate transport system substrate-binding protein